MKSYQEYRQILHGTDKYKSLDYYSYNVNIATFGFRCPHFFPIFTMEVGRSASIHMDLDKGNMYMRVKRYKEAEKAFRKHSISYPEDFRGHYNLAISLLEQNLLSASVLSISRAIEIKSDVIVFYSTLTGILIKEKLPDLAYCSCLKVTC